MQKWWGLLFFLFLSPDIPPTQETKVVINITRHHRLLRRQAAEETAVLSAALIALLPIGDQGLWYGVSVTHNALCTLPSLDFHLSLTDSESLSLVREDS